jgi:hypothetical protein
MKIRSFVMMSFRVVAAWAVLIALLAVSATPAADADAQARKPAKKRDTPINCSFAGTWIIHWYDNQTGAGEAVGKQTMKIVVTGDKATGYSDFWSWDGKMEEFCSGPLTENGQVWNAKRYVDGGVQLRFDDIHFDPDCNRFVGKWSGEAPHNLAWIGIRTDERKLPPPMRNTVELSNRNRSQTLAVTPGLQVTVKVATYAGTGYQMEMVPLRTSDLTVTGPRDEPMPRPSGTKSKVVVGAGTWKVYQVKVGPQAKGTHQLKFNFSRAKGKAEIEYVLTLRVLR